MSKLSELEFFRAIAGNTDLLTAQLFLSTQDQLSVAIMVSGEGEEAFTKVRTVGLMAQERFFESVNPIPLRIEELFNLFKQELAALENIQLLFVVFKENALFIQTFGLHQVFLQREKSELSLLTNGSSQLISGQFESGDKLLLISAKDPAWDKEVTISLIKEGAVDLEDQLENLLQSGVATDPIAALLVLNTSTALSLNEVEAVLSTEVADNLPSPRKLTLSLPSNKKILLPVLGFLVLLVILGLIFFLYQKNQSGKNSQVQALLIQAHQKYAEAQSLKDTNPDQAQQDLMMAQSQVAQVLKINPRNSEAQKLKTDMAANTNNILKVYEVSNWPLFLSLDLIKPGFSASRMSFSLGKVLLLDEKQKTLVALDLKSKKPQLLAGQAQLGNALFAGINGTDVYSFSEDKGIIHIDLDTNKLTPAVKKDDEWGKITDLYAFSSNFYLLDSLKNQIWKYTPIKSGYSDKITYLADNSKVDFAGARRLQVDFSVWVLKAGPEIYKFTGGNEDNFSVGGLDQHLKDFNSFFPVEGEDQVYLLDSQNSRLVVLKKSGQYLAQYKGDKFKTASDLVVDQENKKIYLLEANKIYQIDLK